MTQQTPTFQTQERRRSKYSEAYSVSLFMFTTQAEYKASSPAFSGIWTTLCISRWFIWNKHLILLYAQSYFFIRSP